VGDAPFIRDLDSRNGVFVRGVQVRESPLVAGDVVRLGEWVGVVAAIRDSDPNPRFAEIAPGLLGGPTLALALELGLRAAKSNLPLVLQGETGTGKELTARAVHELSGREGPFVGVNCAALPEALAEAELFGYRRGAFTGAESAHVGHFRSAQRGTLSSPICRSRCKPSCYACSKSGGSCRSGNRRRLRSTFGSSLPRISRWRTRCSTSAFASTCAPASTGSPFNLRELDLLIRRLLVLHAHEPILRLDHLPERMRDPAEAEAKSHPASSVDRDELELEQLIAHLKRHKGNLARAAAELGISRQLAYRLLEGGQLELESFRSRD
jgi:transcriptional regulator of acetoin/glycerol metabolism